MKVKVKQYNICHNGIVYKTGDVFDISNKDFKGFIKKYCEAVEEKKEPLETKTEKVDRKERAKKQ